MIEFIRHLISNDHGEWQAIMAVFSAIPFLSLLIKSKMNSKIIAQEEKR